MKTITLREGKAKLTVPAQSLIDPHKAIVFYNPKMSFSRTISSLAISSIDFKEMRMVDGLCATGARGLRYALETNKIKEVLFVDGNEECVPFLKKNIKLNSLKLKKVKTRVKKGDFNSVILQEKERFELIELDPFGTPAPFLHNSIYKLENESVFSVTATDLANLCGAQKKACIKLYQAAPLNNEFAHETALRILLGKIAVEAAEQDYSIEPLLSYYTGYHVKTIVKMERRSEKASAYLENLGYGSYCEKCLERSVQKEKMEKCECGNALRNAGKLWIGNTSDSNFLKKVINENEKRKKEKQIEDREVEKMLSLLLEENDQPSLFYDLHFIADHFNLPAKKKIAEIVQELKNKGFKASRTHFTPQGIRTNASIKEIRSALVN